MRVLLGKDIVTNKQVYHLCLQWQPRDMWLGVFFESLKPLRAYVCLVPCFPLHIKIERNAAHKARQGVAA